MWKQWILKKSTIQTEFLELCEWGRSGRFTKKLTLLFCFLGGLNEGKYWWGDNLVLYQDDKSSKSYFFGTIFAHAHGRQKRDQCKNHGPRQESKFASLLTDLWGSFFYFIRQVPLSNEVFPPRLKQFQEKSLAINFNFTKNQIERLMGKNSLDVFCREKLLLLSKKSPIDLLFVKTIVTYFVILKGCSDEVILLFEIFLSFESGGRQIDVFWSVNMRWIVSEVRIDSPKRINFENFEIQYNYYNKKTSIQTRNHQFLFLQSGGLELRYKASSHYFCVINQFKKVIWPV